MNSGFSNVVIRNTHISENIFYIYLKVAFFSFVFIMSVPPDVSDHLKNASQLTDRRNRLSLPLTTVYSLMSTSTIHHVPYTNSCLV